MKKTLAFFIGFYLGGWAFGQSVPGMDTVIYPFWNKNLYVKVHLNDPDGSGPEKNNGILTLLEKVGPAHRILLRDSVHMDALQFNMADMNGDGNNDLLLYRLSNGPFNSCYSLYLVDQAKGWLKRVRRFERLFNPYFNWSNCTIYGIENFESLMVMRNYLIDINGNLFLAR